MYNFLLPQFLPSLNKKFCLRNLCGTRKPILSGIGRWLSVALGGEFVYLYLQPHFAAPHTFHGGLSSFVDWTWSGSRAAASHDRLRSGKPLSNPWTRRTFPITKATVEDNNILIGDYHIISWQGVEIRPSALQCGDFIRAMHNFNPIR